MKKLKLKALELGAKELLTREQLKMVLGGDFGSGSGSGSGSGTTCNCNSSDDCKDTSKPSCVNGCGGPKGGYYGVCAKQ
jgi:hypothetical protein